MTQLPCKLQACYPAICYDILYYPDLYHKGFVPCLRVNTVPVYWEANKRAKGSQVHAQAKIGEKAQLTD